MAGACALLPPVPAAAGARAEMVAALANMAESALAAAPAARLGWPGTAIEVIDAGLGLSGRTASHRDGFKQLVARVCLGEVGAVFGLEVSRLARSNAGLARLLELARLTSTLV